MRQPGRCGAEIVACFVDLPVGESKPSMRLHQIAFSMRQQTESGRHRAVSAEALASTGKREVRFDCQGVVLTMHDNRAKLSHEVASEVRSFFGAKVYETMIPRNVRLSEAPSHGKPILLYDYDCAGSQAYIALAREIIDRVSRAEKE